MVEFRIWYVLDIMPLDLELLFPFGRLPPISEVVISHIRDHLANSENLVGFDNTVEQQ